MITQEFETGKFILNFALFYRRKLHGQKFVFSKVISLNFRKLKRSSIFILLVLEESVLFSLFYRKLVEFIKNSVSKGIFIFAAMIFAGMGNVWGAEYTLRSGSNGKNWNGTDTWRDKSSGSWGDTANHPGEGDTAYIDQAVTINVTDSIHIDTVQGNQNTTLVIQSGVTFTVDNLLIGDSSTKTITINVLNGGKLILNNANKDTGNLKITGTGSLEVADPDILLQLSTDQTNPGTWTGLIDTDWSNPFNWSGITDISQLETLATVTIPAGCTNYPSATDINLNGNLIIEAGASATFTGSNTIGKITADTASTITAGDSITVTNDSTIGNLNLNGDLVFVNSTNKLTFTGNIESPGSPYSLQTTGSGEFIANEEIGTTNKLQDLTINGNFTQPSGPKNISLDGALSINGGAQIRGNIEAASVELKSDSSFLGACSIITTSGDQTYTGNFLINTNDSSGLILKTTSGKVKFNGNIDTHTAPAKPLTIDGNAVLDGTIGNTSPLDTITITGTSSLRGTITTTGTQTYTRAVTLAGNTTFNAGTSSVTFGDTITGGTHNLTIGSATDATQSEFNGNVTGVSTLNLYGNSTLGANINVAVWNNPNDKTITPGTSTVTVSSKVNGSNTFNNLTISSTTGSVQFEAGKTQTVNGTFTAAGSSGSEVSLLSSTTGTQWNLDAATATISYAKIKDANNISGTPIAPSNSINLGNNTGFDLPSKFRWSATAASSDVTTLSNWELNTEGTTWITATSLPGESSTDDEVEIQASTNNPLFASATDVICKKLTIDSGAELTLSNAGNIQVKDGSFTNEGKIIFSNTGRTTNSYATPVAIMDSAHGTVEYKGSANQITNFNASGESDYYNLIVSTTLPFEGGHQIKIANNFTLSDSCNITTGGQSLYITGASSIGGNITTGHNQEYNGTVTFTTASSELLATDTGTSTGGTPYRTYFGSTITGKSGGTALTFNDAAFSSSTTMTNISTLTVNEITNNAGTITTSGLQTYKGAVTNTGTINVANTGNNTTAVIFADGYNGTGGTITGNSVANPVVEIQGGDVKLGTLNHNGDKLLFSTGTSNITDNLTCYNLEIASGAAVTGGSSTITVQNGWTNNGTFTPGTSTVKVAGNVSGDNSFYNLTIDGTANSTSQITGSNTIGTLSCHTDNKTISFTADTTQTVTSKLDISSSATKEIILTGAGIWNIDVSSISTVADKTVANVKVKNSTADSTKVIASASLSLGGNTNWIIAQNFVWTGAASTDWATPSNWSISFNGSTTTATDYPGSMSDSDTVEIGNSATKEPDFSNAASITITSLNISNTSRKLTISNTGDIKISNTTTPLTNKGTVIYTSSGRIKNNTATPVAIMDAVNGTVEFTTDASTIDNISTDNDYNNLILSGPLTLLGDIKTKGTLVLRDDVTITGSGKKLTIGSTTDSIDSTARSLTLGATGAPVNFEFKNIGSNYKLNNITAFGTFTANPATISITGALDCKSSATFRGNINAASVNVDGTLIFGHATRKVTTTGTAGQTYNGPVQINTDASDTDSTLTLLAGTNTVNFNSTIDKYTTGSPVPELIIGDTSNLTNVKFNGNISQLTSLSVKGTTEFTSNISSVSTTGNQSYTGNVSFASNFTMSTGTTAVISIENDLTGSTNALTLSSGTMKFKTGKFETGTFTVNTGATFTQTGDNGTNLQSVAKIVNGGTMTWDSASDGGTITIGSDGITQTDGSHLVNFNKKNVTLTTSSVSGIFYNLTIPNGVALTNNLAIVVRNNLTVDGSGSYIHNNKDLYLGSYSFGGTTYASTPAAGITGTITRSNSPATPATINFGKTTINPGASYKVFEIPAQFVSLSSTDSTPGGKITFKKDITVNNNSTLSTKAQIDFAADDPASRVTQFTSGVSISNSTKITLGGTFKSTATASSAISIASPVELTSNTIFSSNGQNISFGSTISNATGTSNEFSITTTNTSGTIEFKGNVSVKKFTVTEGKVNLGGASAVTITTANDDILFNGNATNAKVTLYQPVTFTTGTGAGNITLNQPIDASSTAATQSLTLSSGTGKIFLNNTIGNTQPIGSLTATGLTQVNATVKTNNKPITFNSTTYLACKNTADANATTLSSGTSNITVANSSSDLYISALKADNNAKNITITAGTLSVSGNIALFNGNVTLKANMTSGKDIILLNGNDSTMYKLESETNHITYINSMRTSANKLKEPSLTAFPTTMPDTTTIDHTVYKSSLSDFNGKTIKAGQNFYDNGVNLSPSAGWTLSLKANDDAKVSFAEAYNAHIRFCTTVTAHDGTFAWLSAGEGCTNDGNNATDEDDQIDYGTDNGTGAVTCHPTGIAFLHPVFLVADTTKSAAEGRTTGPEIPNLSGTYAVRDNVIRIEFVRNNYTTGIDQKSATALIENSNNEISAAASRFKFNDGQTAFIGTYIDAECTESTDGRGDLAVFYIKANSKWNLDASGTAVGTTPDTDGVLHTDVYNDIEFTKIISGVFASLYDNHKNRIADYSQTPYARPTPDSREGHRFTAVISRYVIDAMHISFTVADFTTKKLYIYFNDALDNDNITWGGSPIATEDSIKFYSDTTTQAPSITIENIELNALNDHGIVLTLNNLDYSMIQYGIKIEYSSSYFLNNKIHGKHNLVVNNGESHCITDVITNCVEVQYAYDNRNDTYIDSTGGLAPEDSIVMRDFTGTGKHNKVFADKNITLVTKDIAPEDSAGNPADFKYKLVADITPGANCDGTTYEEISGHKTRFWFAEGTTAIDGFSPVLNSSTNKRNSVSNPDLITQTVNTDNIVYYFHNFSEESPCLNWPSGSDVRFLFEVLDGTGQPITINHSFDGATYEEGTQRSPLYCARLINPLDPTSIDLWSFLISEPYRQRGGVSIYSNVINATNKDFCTLEVNMPKDGNLRVIVMTADGNIVKYLENGRQSTGLHYYYWNGTNNAGDTVARGIYFVRVVGPEIEETRKVMVVK